MHTSCDYSPSRTFWRGTETQRYQQTQTRQDRHCQPAPPPPLRSQWLLTCTRARCTSPLKETLPLFRQRVRESTWVCARSGDARSKDRQHLADDKPIDPPCAVVAGWWPDACVRGGERDSAARSAFSASCLLSILQNVAPPCPQRRMYCQDNLRTIS